MRVDAEKSLHKKLKKMSAKVNLAIKQEIINLEQIDNITQIKSEKLKGSSDRYKIRVGNYRIVYKKITNTYIKITAIADRKDVYRRLFGITI